MSGDSISGIASTFCVSPDDLIAANSWSDGLAHVIHPGDHVTLPGDACTPAPASATSSTDAQVGVDTTADGPVYRPFWGTDIGDGFTEYDNPACTPAMEAMVSFEDSLSPAGDLLTALDDLSPTGVPLAIVTDVQTFVTFRDEWFEIDRTFDQKYPTLHGIEDDPDYQRMVVAGLAGPFAAQRAIWDFIYDQCLALPETTGDGTTP